MLTLCLLALSVQGDFLGWLTGGAEDAKTGRKTGSVPGEPLQLISAYYGLNDCVGLPSDVIKDKQKLLDLGCNVQDKATSIKGKEVPPEEEGMMSKLAGFFSGLVGSGDSDEPDWETSASSIMKVKVGCAQTGTMFYNKQFRDAMPINFNYMIVSGLKKEIFRVTRNDGEVITPDCVLWSPASEDDERSTPALIGNLGDGFKDTVWPTKVEIVGDLFFNVNGEILNGKGLVLQTDEMRYSTKPLRMVRAYLETMEEATEGDSAANGCQDGFEGADYILKVVLSGGGTQDGVNPLTSSTKYFDLLDKDGNRLTDGYLGLGGIGDGDNFYDLCLDSSKLDVKALAEVKATCDPEHRTQFFPPKGVVGCTPHTMKVDHHYVDSEFEQSCMCEFVSHYNAYCDPLGMFDRAAKCMVKEDSSCADKKYNWLKGHYYSKQACEFGLAVNGDQENLFVDGKYAQSNYVLFGFAALGAAFVAKAAFDMIRTNKYDAVPDGEL